MPLSSLLQNHLSKKAIFICIWLIPWRLCTISANWGYHHRCKMLHVMLVIILDHTSAWASSSPSSPSPSPSIFYVWDLLLQFSHIPLVLHRVPCDPLVSVLVIKSSRSKSKSKCIIDQWPRTKTENNPIMTCKMKNLPIWTCRLVKSFLNQLLKISLFGREGDWLKRNQYFLPASYTTLFGN